MADSKQQLQISPRGTRGSRIPWGLMRFMEPLMRGQITRYRKNASAEAPGFRGARLVLLTTHGAKSGKERTQPLGGFPQGNDVWVIIASKGGASTHPAWFINLAKNPGQVWLEAGTKKFHMRPEVLKGAEREAMYANCAAASPGYGKYVTATDREIPVIRLTPIV
jgi:deazaflavin-dependent oxidoreductase (nitroreductase family)